MSDSKSDDQKGPPNDELSEIELEVHSLEDFFQDIKTNLGYSDVSAIQILDNVKTSKLRAQHIEKLLALDFSSISLTYPQLQKYQYIMINEVLSCWNEYTIFNNSDQAITAITHYHKYLQAEVYRLRTFMDDDLEIDNSLIYLQDQYQVDIYYDFINNYKALTH